VKGAESAVTARQENAMFTATRRTVSMAARRRSLQGLWSSRTAFVLAVSGSAVGLGNLWKFPYITGEHGGGAFLLVYLLCVFAIGLPMMVSEVMLGRRGRRNPIATMRLLGQEEAGNAAWRLVGVVAVLSGFVILSFYSVVAGWSLEYVFLTAGGAFADREAGEVTQSFSRLTSSWWRLTLWHSVFMAMTITIVANGVQGGLERAVRILMPLLVVLLVALVIFAGTTGHLGEALVFLLRPDFSKLTADGVLVALGHAFFTLSLGMGAVMAYGAYLPQDASIPATSVAVVVTDTLVALLATLVVFPLVFAFGLDPASGPGLVFETLPLAFGSMELGSVFGAFFFVVIATAALTSAIGLLEPAVAWLTESSPLSRGWAAVALGMVIWALGLLTIFSFNVLADIRFWQGTLYNNLEHVTVNILLPLVGLATTVFASWVMSSNSSFEELDDPGGVVYSAWRFLARFVAPAGVGIVFLNAVFGGGGG
jgi:NSS family neurotransmitter:Na+ symporter